MEFKDHSLQHQLQVKWDKSPAGVNALYKVFFSAVDQIGSELSRILLQMTKNFKKIKNTDILLAPLL